MTRITRRRAGLIAGALLLSAAIVYASRVASILVAYKSKMLCSEVFLAERDPHTVETELEVDDLELLRVVSSSVDRTSRTVTSSLAGVIRRHSTYDDQRGCALVFGSGTRREPLPHGEHVRGNDFHVAANNAALEAVLDRAFAEPNPDHPRRTRAVVVLHEGQIVAERYAAGFTSETPLIGWSMTKTVINALVGILVKEGRLSITGRLPVPEWQKEGDPRGAITLDDLLHMSSGLRFDENPSNPRSDATVMLLGTADNGEYAARKSLLTTPGTTWRYSSGTSNIIARAMRAAIGDDRDYLSFPRRALFDRIGMPRAILETDAEGTFVGSSFLYATAREWARVGLLYLQDGVWEGERILPEGWVAYTRRPAPADAAQRYGAHVWLQVPDEYRGDAPLPADSFHAVGHAGQFVTMIPSSKVVIVRLGLTRYPDAWDHTAFVRDVLAAIMQHG